MRVSVFLAASAIAAASANPVQVYFGQALTDAGVGLIDLLKAETPAIRSFWPPWGRPASPPREIDLSKYTIGQILNWTLHHRGDEKHRTLPIHKLAWAVNQSEIAKKIYRDDSLSMTLFAPVDASLERPGHGHGHADHPFAAAGHVDDDSDRHERFVKIINLLLMYHTLPHSYGPHELADKATVGTTLNTTKDGHVPFRLRVEGKVFPRPEISVNFYAKTSVEVKAKNGRIYLISAPLLPPPGPVSTALLFPGAFSTLTSGVQLAELDRELAPGLHKYQPESDDADHSLTSLVRELIAEVVSENVGGGSGVTAPPEYTVLAPTNIAFLRLGGKLNAFLFSPFGRRALKAVLGYHVLPGITLHTDYLHNSTVKIQQTEETNVDVDFAALGLYDEDAAAHVDLLSASGMLEGPPHPPHHGPHGPPRPPHHDHGHHGKANVTHLHDVKTAFGNHTLDIDIIKYRIFGRGPLTHRIVVKPKGEDAKPVPVLIADAVNRNGATHVLGSVLRPPIPHRHCGGGDQRDRGHDALSALL